jgi:hypothetical protein
MIMTRNIFIMVTALTVLAPPVFADSEEINCHTPENVRFKNEARKSYENMLANNKAGKFKSAYEAAQSLDAHCITEDEQELERIDADRIMVLKQSSKKLGEQAEAQGKFTEAYDYYVNFHGIDADRAQLKLATSRPDHFDTVQQGINYFRHMRKILSEGDTGGAKPADLDKARLAAMNHFTSQDSVDAMDPQRKTRLQAVNDDIRKLEAIATKNGDTAMAEEEKVFTARKTSVTAKGDSLDELETARKWYDLTGQEKRANERAIKRGDTLAADDGRNFLRLAIRYYEFARNDSRIVAVKDKARRLGDTQLQKGDKVRAAEYYQIAGLDDKALELSETHEKESAAAEAKRQEKFKQEQKSLEDELGF